MNEKQERLIDGHRLPIGLTGVIPCFDACARGGTHPLAIHGKGRAMQEFADGKNAAHDLEWFHVVDDLRGDIDSRQGEPCIDAFARVTARLNVPMSMLFASSASVLVSPGVGGSHRLIPGLKRPQPNRHRCTTGGRMAAERGPTSSVSDAVSVNPAAG